MTGGETYASADRGARNEAAPRHAARNQARLNELFRADGYKAYEFLFVWSPLKMKGSPGNPVALY